MARRSDLFLQQPVEEHIFLPENLAVIPEPSSYLDILVRLLVISQEICLLAFVCRFDVPACLQRKNPFPKGSV
jgi:hypothetical protein